MTATPAKQSSSQMRPFFMQLKLNLALLESSYEAGGKGFLHCHFRTHSGLGNFGTGALVSFCIS